MGQGRCPIDKNSCDLTSNMAARWPSWFLCSAPWLEKCLANQLHILGVQWYGSGEVHTPLCSPFTISIQWKYRTLHHKMSFLNALQSGGILCELYSFWLFFKISPYHFSSVIRHFFQNPSQDLITFRWLIWFPFSPCNQKRKVEFHSPIGMSHDAQRCWRLSKIISLHSYSVSPQGGTQLFWES
jgi:hypothetical protein